MKFQPSQSPICNANNDCFFPALSKWVSEEQGLSKGSLIFTQEELWSAVEKCYKEFPMDTLARAYVQYAQIAYALYEHKGGDEFVRNRGGMQCNVQKSCVTICDQETGKPIGVEVVSRIEANKKTESHSQIRPTQTQ